MRNIKYLIIFLMVVALTGCTPQISTSKEEVTTEVTQQAATTESFITNTDISDSSSEITEIATKSDTEKISENSSPYDELLDYSFDISNIPEFDGTSAVYVTKYNNLSDYIDQIPISSCEYYSSLDNLGRCGVCYSVIGVDIMPTEERGEIGEIKPSGWHTVKYNNIIEGKFLYNRCHILGYQLTGENSNKDNLITGTRFMNVDGMLPYENQIADYMHKNPNNHILYRVVPIFIGDELVCRGVLMEALSMEDAELDIHVFCYNVQPGVEINYSNGESKETGKYYEEALNAGIFSTVMSDYEVIQDNTEQNNESIVEENASDNTEITYVLNTNTMKFHLPSCESVADIKEKNKSESTKSRDELINEGYAPCKRCNP